MRMLIVFCLALASCKTITLREEQFYDARRVTLPDSVRSAEFWPASYKFSDAFITAQDTDKLYTVALIRPGATFTILYLGGANFQIGQDYGRFSPLIATGANIVVADYPGYGLSTGKPSLASFEAAALLAYEHALRTTCLPSSRLIVHGHSLGSVPATYLAQKRPVGGLVLESAPTNADEWTHSLTPWYARPFVRINIPSTLRARDNVTRIMTYKGPLLILAGGRDRETNPRMSRRLFERAGTSAAAKSLMVSPSAGHMVVRDDKRALEAYTNFLAGIHQGEPVRGQCGPSSSANSSMK